MGLKADRRRKKEEEMVISGTRDSAIPLLGRIGCREVNFERGQGDLDLLKAELKDRQSV